MGVSRVSWNDMFEANGDGSSSDCGVAPFASAMGHEAEVRIKAA